jgi:hypothetical protein
MFVTYESLKKPLPCLSGMSVGGLTPARFTNYSKSGMKKDKDGTTLAVGHTPTVA